MTVSTEIPGYVVGTWDIDPVHSHIDYVVRHLGIGRSRGRKKSCGWRARFARRSCRAMGSFT